MAEKRRVSGRRSRDAKRRRTSTKAPTPKAATPAEEATPVESPQRETTPLPNKVVDSRPLPTLSEPQSLDLPNDEFRSIAESGVLLASLERSRQKWLSGAFLEKYWTKTSGRKDAPPPPPGNPHKSWMKEIGPCTIVVEPLVLEATAFYVKEPGPPPPPAAYAPSPTHQPQQQQPYQHTPQQHYQQQQQQRPLATGSPYGAPYSTPSAQYQPRPQNYPPSDQRQLPPIMPATARAPPPPQPAAPPKQSPDPVIQMLASRASSDPELKALMKIVATGNANQEQLRIFQRHIDELTAMINANKAQSSSQAPSPAPSSYGHPTPSRPPSTAPPVIQPHPSTPSQRPPIYPMPHHAHHQPYSHQPLPPPKYPSYPIVLEFQGQGASPDRFRFPANAILEFLTPYSMLASFLVTRKGSEVNPQLDAETEYYEPVTLKIIVPEGRSAARDVLQFINRGVKPADQVRTWMTERIDKCMRAQRRQLALRLPYKSGIVEIEDEVPVVQEVKPKPKPAPRKKKEDKDNVQETNNDATKSNEQGVVNDSEEGGAKDIPVVQQASQPTALQTAPTTGLALDNAQQGAKQTGPQATEAVTETPASAGPSAQTADGPAPDAAPVRRNSRKKSVRISEVHDIGGSMEESATGPNP